MTDQPAPEFSTRPRRPLIVSAALSLVMTLLAAFGYWALGPDVRSRISGLQLGTLILFLVFMVVVALAPVLSYVRADATGLRFRNGIRTHALPWEAVQSIRMTPGDAWAYVILDIEFAPEDHDRFMLLGIQRTDGQKAVRDVAALRAVADRYRPTLG